MTIKNQTNEYADRQLGHLLDVEQLLGAYRAADNLLDTLRGWDLHPEFRGVLRERLSRLQSDIIAVMSGLEVYAEMPEAARVMIRLREGRIK